MRQKWGKNGKPNCTVMREHSIISQDLKMHYKAYIYKLYKMLCKILKYDDKILRIFICFFVNHAILWDLVASSEQ